MSRIRVVLADLSPMLTSLISELIGSADVEVVGRQSGGDLPALVADTGADVVIIPGNGQDLPEAGRRLLDDRTRFRILALTDHARSGVLGDLAVRQVGLEDISKGMLLGAVTGEHSAATRPAGGPDSSGEPPATDRTDVP